MVITAITPSDENGRREIFVDGASYVCMPADLVMALDIHVGDTLDDARLEEITAKAESISALQKAYTYLSYNALSRKTLRDKLCRAGFSENAVEIALDRLEELELIDDDKYGRRILHVMRKNKHWGRRKIVFEMKKRGLSDALISDLINDGYDETENARLFFQNKYADRDLKDASERRRVIAGMSRYGFDYDSIRAVIAQFEDEL